MLGGVVGGWIRVGNVGAAIGAELFTQIHGYVAMLCSDVVLYCIWMKGVGHGVAAGVPA
jgi:hypothetical protein